MKKIELTGEEHERLIILLEVTIECSCGDDEKGDRILKKILKKLE